MSLWSRRLATYPLVYLPSLPLLSLAVPLQDYSPSPMVLLSLSSYQSGQALIRASPGSSGEREDRGSRRERRPGRKKIPAREGEPGRRLEDFEVLLKIARGERR